MKELGELNGPQKEAVNHKSGPLLVLAGAGAGKTRVITSRIYNLIQSGSSPREILAITFTNKAAKEMRERVFALLGEESASGYQSFFDDRPFVGTFHSLGVNILRENHKVLGLPKHFSIYDRNDSVKAFREAIKSADYDPKQIAPGKVYSIVSKLKGDFIDLKEYSAEAGNQYFARMISAIWENYERTLAKEKALDFSDLLLKTTKLLQENKSVREHYQKRWKYVHIDEYQDTNKVQYLLANLISEKHKNIFVVGDIDQNIYSWRGADIQNIFNFEKDFQNPKIILLEQNYRSTKTILDASNMIIEKNKNRKEKRLFTNNPSGEKIGTFVAFDEQEEAEFVADKSRELIRKGVNPNNIAVLYRANFQSRVLEELFLSMNVPYQVLGVRFFERKEIKDSLSFIRAALNPDSFSDIKRIINVPPRGIGKVTLIKMFSNKEGEMTPAVRKKVADFYSLLERIQKFAMENKPSDTIKFVIREIGLENKLRKGTEDDQERLENIKELATLATRYDSLEPEEGIQKLLEDAALASEQDSLDEKTKKAKAGVKLMTVHASKGLEFEYVFIVGLEEGLFPHEMMENKDSTRDTEEERRLFYVALTRAKKKVYLTYAGLRTIYGSKQTNLPSTFIVDLDEEFLEEEMFEGGVDIIEVD